MLSTAESVFAPKSISGHLLDGNLLMRFVYIDEAGLSKRSEEPFLTVAAVILHADQKLVAVERCLQGILERHIPKAQQDNFVFHAAELFNGGGKVFKRERSDFIGPQEWPMERRFKIADELAKIPARFDLQIAFGFVDREDFESQPDFPTNLDAGQKTILEHVAAFTTCSMMVEQWMRNFTNGEVCMLVVEDHRDARNFIREAQNYHQSKNVEGLEDPKLSLHFPLRKIKEDPLFQPKKPSHPLIIADFCAYVFKRVLMRDQRYVRFFEPMKKKVISFDEKKLLQHHARRLKRVSSKVA